MVIEKFSPGWKERVYAHFEAHGRLLPLGLEYLDSWRVTDRDVCFQLMQTNDFSLFKVWQANWDKIGPWGIFQIYEIAEKTNKAMETNARLIDNVGSRSEMSIRAFKPGDLPIVVDLFARTVREINRRDYSPVQVGVWAPDNPDLDAWKERLSRGLVWVYEATETVVGFIQLEDNGHIDLLYVHPEYQRQGIASSLLEKVLAWALQKRLPRLFTEASVTARPFFERFSFQVVCSQQVMLRGVQFENFVMQRYL